MIKKLALAVLVVALGSVTAMAADFNGKWSADVPGRNGNTTPTTFTFTVDPSAMTVTGTVTGRHGRRAPSPMARSPQTPSASMSFAP